MKSPDLDDAPLDPAQARIVQKIRRLALGSTLIMVLGILLVLGVIGYRLFATAERGRPAADVIVPLPKDARVLSTAVADGKLAVTIEVAGAVEVRLYDLTTLEPRGRLRFTDQP